MKSPEKSIDLTHKTIVVMYMLYFGDMISITPFLEILRRAADHSKIILVIDSRFQDALRYNPDIDEIVPFDRHGSQKSLGATWKAGRKLAEQNPDILITLHGTARTSVMAWAMHPRFWAGEAGTEIDRFLMDLPMTIETYDCHAVDKYIHVLQRMGVQDLKHSGMKTYTCPGWEKEADEFSQRQEFSRENAWRDSVQAAPHRKKTGLRKNSARRLISSQAGDTVLSSLELKVKKDWSAGLFPPCPARELFQRRGN